MDIVVRIFVGVYVTLLAVFIVSMGTLVLSDSLHLSSDAFILWMVAAFNSFIGLLGTFPLAYYSVKRLENR